MIFGFGKDNSIDEIAAEIEKNYKNFFKITKETKSGSLIIRKDDLHKTFKSQEQFKFTKKKAQWKNFVGDIVLHFDVSSKKQNEYDGALFCSSTFPGFFINTFNSSVRYKKKIKKNVMCINVPDNDKALDVKEILVNKYKFSDPLKGIE